VRIEAVDPVRIAVNGVSVTTIHADARQAILRVRTSVANDTGRRQKVNVATRILRDGWEPLVVTTTAVTVAPHSSTLVPQEITLASPALWSPDTPARYELVSRAAVGDRFVDVDVTRFGIRTIAVSPERGFLLNGEPLQLNGANVHHDHGPLGAASHRDVEYRRVRLLKAAGFNFVRTSHNPPAPAFLDACDELGLLVMDEAFDCWVQGKLPHDYSVKFKETWQRDLDAMILRDRHHPSIVLWSIGNEIQEVGKPEGIALAKQLAQRVRELDPSRLVSCGWTVPWIIPSEWNDVDPSFAVLDVAGYNYQQARAAEDHERVPSRVMLATESYQADTFECWATVQDHPWFIGDTVWTGWDYLGESGIGRVYPPGEKVFQHWETDHWPWYGAYCGDIDITGWRKPISHYRNIVWNRGEKLYLAVQVSPPTPGAWQPTMWGVPPTLDSWTWPGHEGRTMIIEVYSRHDRVRLMLNDRLVGEKPTTRAEEFKAVFEVPYEPGVLRAVGVSGGNEAETFTLETAGPAVGVRLRPDWGDETLQRTFPAFAIAEIVDAGGRVVPTADHRIEFSTGAGSRILAVATGDLTSPEPYVATSRRAWRGRAQVIVEPGEVGEDGELLLTITATVPELDGATHTLAAEPLVLLSP
jgi:beta-galactosidase